MTDDPDVTEVRRLLAEARPTEPMPEDVAARMDAVLAGLAKSEPPAEPPAADVVPLAARRRRKAAGWLLAAAAVVVGGVVVAPHLSSSGSSSPTAAENAAGGSSTPTDLNLGNTGDAQSPGVQKSDGGEKLPQMHGQRVVVRPRHFSADAKATRTQLLRAADSFDAAESTSCPDVPTGADAVAAEYRHVPAALVFRRPSGGTQVVELYLCGQAQPLRTATLPVP